MADLTPVRYIHPKGSTFEQMRESLHRSPLYALGDAILIWVNEGDFWMLDPRPVDAEAAERERQREDAVLAEADAIRARRKT